MTPPPVRRPTAARLGILAAAGLATFGCGRGEEIRTYQVPHATDKGPAVADAGPGEYRILGAMFPADQPVWFFKLTGKADAIAAHSAEFDKFLASVKMPEGQTRYPTYELPEGWKSSGPTGMRADTIRIGPPQEGLELTVIPATGGARENVKRWADQVGSPADFARATKEVTTASGAKGLRVEVTGPKKPPAGGPMMMGK